MATSTAPQAHRFTIIDNGDGTFSVRDIELQRWVTTTDGMEDFSYRDAWDLLQEHIWS